MTGARCLCAIAVLRARGTNDWHFLRLRLCKIIVDSFNFLDADAESSLRKMCQNCCGGVSSCALFRLCRKLIEMINRFIYSLGPNGVRGKIVCFSIVERYSPFIDFSDEWRRTSIQYSHFWAFSCQNYHAFHVQLRVHITDGWNRMLSTDRDNKPPNMYDRSNICEWLTVKQASRHHFSNIRFDFGHAKEYRVNNTVCGFFCVNIRLY